jgi:alpha-galactosidase
VWFEPERVTPGTWLYDNHPEWLLGRDGEQKLLNLGNPDARAWLTDHVDRTLTDQGIDLYRQDYNIDPLGFWRAADTENREGIVENAYVSGYLAYWDELRRRHPALVIDTCASGGHRNDLETMRRAVPLLRSDYIIEPVGQQGHTYGLSFWFSFYGTGSGRSDVYAFRSTMCPHFTACYDMRERGLPYDQLRTLFAQWREVAPYMLGDFYPLTAYSIASDVWIAWQFDRPDLSAGMVEAFRRADSPYETARFRLSALDPDADYEVQDLDTPNVTRLTGRQLMEDGLVVSMPDRPAAKVIVYQRAT